MNFPYDVNVVAFGSDLEMDSKALSVIVKANIRITDASIMS